MASSTARVFALLAGVLSVALLFTASRPDLRSAPEEPSELDRIYTPFDSLLTDLASYAWPIDTTLATTSVFGDFRSTHFHAGIDISTRNQVGLPVRAMQKGFVTELHVDHSGYGRSVELTHDDGFTTWYAHLLHFSPRLEKIVRERQQRTGRYTVDVKLDSGAVLVERGDVIAYNGNTGSGGPHLHFELRDQNGNPVNPLLSPEFATRALDRTAPTLEEVGFVPLEAETFIQGDARPWYVHPVSAGKGSYRIPSVVHMSGTMGITIRLRDGVGVRSFLNRVASLALYVDGARAFVSDVARIPWSEGKQIAMHFDWPARGTGRGNHQKLYIDEGNRLPFYHRLPPGSGVVRSGELSHGLHSLEIVAADLNGNETRLNGSMFVNNPAPGDTSSTIAYRTIEFLSSGGKAQPVASERIRKSNSSLTVETEFFRTYAYVRMKSSLPLTSRPRLRITTNAGSADPEVRVLSASHFFSTIPLVPEMGSTLRVEATADVNGAADVRGFEEHTLFPITRSSGGVVALDGGKFQLTFGAGGVYSDLFARAEERNGVVTVQPNDILLDRGGRVRMSISAELSDKKVGLFHDPGPGMQLVAWQRPGGDSTLEGRVYRFLGDFMVLEDESPPSVTRAYVVYRGGRLTASFRVRDYRSGVDGASINMRLDGLALIPQYESETKRIDFVGDVRLEKGRHELVLSVKDKMVNVAEKRVYFWSK